MKTLAKSSPVDAMRPLGWSSARTAWGWAPRQVLLAPHLLQHGPPESLFLRRGGASREASGGPCIPSQSRRADPVRVPTTVARPLRPYCARRRCELNRYQIYREVKLHSSLQHENIIMLYAAFQQGDQVVLVQEYADAGDLFLLLHRCGHVVLFSSCTCIPCTCMAGRVWRTGHGKPADATATWNTVQQPWC